MKFKELFCAFFLSLLVGCTSSASTVPPELEVTPPSVNMATATLTLSPVNTSPSALNETTRLEAEQEIYSAMLARGFASDKNVAINENTTLGELGLQNTNQPSNLQHLHLTLLDFYEINKQSYLLSDYLPDNTNYVFIGETEVEQFHNDWEAFSEKYPNTNAVISFSRVGFNPYMKQAMILVNSSVRIFDEPFDFAGDEIVYVFQKVNDKWSLQNQILIWIGG